MNGGNHEKRILSQHDHKHNHWDPIKRCKNILAVHSMFLIRNCSLCGLPIMPSNQWLGEGKTRGQKIIHSHQGQ